MAALVIAEHDNANLNPATLSTIAAASKLGTDITVPDVATLVDKLKNEAKVI